MNKVYVLHHTYEYGDDLQHEESKFIGVYSSLEKAKEAIERRRDMVGFVKYPVDCFCITDILLDDDRWWAEGFVTWEKAEKYRAENNLCEDDEYKKSIYQKKLN